MKKVFILGCGWVGFPLAVQLKEQGHQVWGSTRSTQSAEKFAEAGIIHVSLVVGESFEGNLDFLNNLDVLIVAYPLGSRRMSNQDDYKLHAEWLKKTLVKSLNPDVQVILLSSISVYPENAGEVDETCTILPIGAGLIQLKYEMELQKTFSEIVILRLGGLIGKGRHPGSFFAGKFNIPNPESPVNLIQCEDVIRACMKVVKLTLKSEIINICGDEHPFRRLYYCQMADMVGYRKPEFNDNQEQAGSFKVVCNDKAKKILGIEFSSIRKCE
jgi:nucleoside-diphosphate-sugar epimerase